MSIAENIAAVRARIADAAQEAGRDPGEIMLVGASKMNGAEACREAVAGGIDALGENRVQEMLAKLDEDAYAGAPLHFIGHLQRNKVRQVVGKVELIQSVGSLELLGEIEKCAAKVGVVQDVLLEVNVGGEAAKSGFSVSEIFQGAEAALGCLHIRVLGLMTIPPFDAEREENLRYFEKVRTLYVDIGAKLFHNGFRYLSMGMSGDFEDAIRSGATMVRVGTAIFGSRNYAPPAGQEELP
ncbi:MAG: YggS family pyridoxal phosphate-dependent enzyme [Oscillibacter sp.]|nr:YggS family pyridoxal phosphate-dependent enzyme [Oscillibacter sp.]